jgi:hypothetical protein
MALVKLRLGAKNRTQVRIFEVLVYTRESGGKSRTPDVDAIAGVLTLLSQNKLLRHGGAVIRENAHREGP